MEAFELMVRILLSVHSVLAKLQPTATVLYQEGEDSQNERNINILDPTQLLKASRISEALEKYMSQSGKVGGRNEYERRGGLQVCVCVGGVDLLPPGSFS